jgi:hypothetical protein
MAVAMWKATKYASYILGDYGKSVERKHKSYYEDRAGRAA